MVPVNAIQLSLDDSEAFKEHNGKVVTMAHCKFCGEEIEWHGIWWVDTDTWLRVCEQDGGSLGSHSPCSADCGHDRGE